MQRHDVLRRCQRLVDSLTLPEPFSVDALAAEVAQGRGRPISIQAIPSDAGLQQACGLWISTDDADLIFVEDGTSSLHRDHIVLHELGHMLCDHGGVLDEHNSVMRTLLPDLSPGLMRLLLARGNYTSEEEQEAEVFATLVSSQVRRTRSKEPTPVNELRQALGIRD